ncbi:MAG: hypothetical protein JNM99_25285 [Verrucomicrobiaceae bacterium]|nr:hypothetical protein [Verrucomicrobiaceae bacterium]
MEPLPPNDPLWKLLGKARPVEPRSNFLPNVLREARNTPQQTSWWSSVREDFSAWLTSLQRPALMSVAAFVIVALVVTLLERPVAETSDAATPVAKTAAIQPLADEEMALIADDFSLPTAGLDHMEALVAMEDTSSLTDNEIAFLLY